MHELVATMLAGATFNRTRRPSIEQQLNDERRRSCTLTAGGVRPSRAERLGSQAIHERRGSSQKAANLAV